MRYLCCLFMLCGCVFAAERPADVPAWYWHGHQQRMAIAQKGNINLLFLGDSITDFWRREGKAEWDAHFAPYKAANFGVAGDKTTNVLWRLRNGELEGYQPQLVVLMIGTNDGGSAEGVFTRIRDIIGEIQQRAPGTRILLHGILPAHAPDHARRRRNEAVNKRLAGLAHGEDPKMVVYMDIGAEFVNDQGIISKEIMPDLLHPSPAGYTIWASTITSTVKRLMKQ